MNDCASSGSSLTAAHGIVLAADDRQYGTQHVSQATPLSSGRREEMSAKYGLGKGAKRLDSLPNTGSSVTSSYA
jgi:hypothetical protein